MKDQMMNMSDGMHWMMMGGMGLIWLLAIVALVLGIAALSKYLFFHGHSNRQGRASASDQDVAAAEKR